MRLRTTPVIYILEGTDEHGRPVVEYAITTHLGVVDTFIAWVRRIARKPKIYTSISVKND